MSSASIIELRLITQLDRGTFRKMGNDTMGDTETGDLIPPKPDRTDLAHSSVRAALSLIPYAGGVVTEIFGMIIVPPLEKRRQEWMEAVVEKIRELDEKESITIGDLQNNPGFIDTLSQASLIAVRNHKEEKIRALKNAVYNSALPSAPESAMQHMFLNLVDDLTEWHLRLLRLFQDPKKAGADISEIFAGGLNLILIQIYPELEKRRGFYDRIWSDLYQRGLVKASSLHATVTASGLVEQQTSDFGNEFLRFISELNVE